MRDVIIGIDPGVTTGIATMVRGKGLTHVDGMLIHEAMDRVTVICMTGVSIKVIVEDARLRKWYGKRGDVNHQGVGSIKRDCKIWEDYLTQISQKYDLVFEMKHPIKGGTKINAQLFKGITGWKKKTNEHGRDAAMLIHGHSFHDSDYNNINPIP